MPPAQLAPRRLQRAPGWIAGVCAGLTAYFGVNVWFVRFVFVALTVTTGYGLIAYVLLWLFMPAFDPAALSVSDSEGAGVRKRSTIAYAVGALGTLVSVLEVVATLAEGAGHVSTIWTNIEKVTSVFSGRGAPADTNAPSMPGLQVQTATTIERPRDPPRIAQQHMYVARLSPADHCNSSGVSLGSAQLVVRQDRANVHREDLTGGDREDQRDPLFYSNAARANLAAHLILTAEQQRIILERTPLIGLLSGSDGYRVDILEVGGPFTGCP